MTDAERIAVEAAIELHRRIYDQIYREHDEPVTWEESTYRAVRVGSIAQTAIAILIDSWKQ